MAGDTIQIELTAQDAKAVAAWQRQRDNIELFEKQLDKTAQKSKNVGEQNVGMGDKAMAGFGKTVAAMVGVGSIVQAWTTAVALVTAEINNAVDRQKDAATKQLTLPAAQRQLFANIGSESKELGETAKDRNRNALKMASKLSEESGVDLKTATEALSNAFSARQGTDTTQTAYEAARAGLRASPEDTETAKTLGAAALRLRAGNEGITSEQAIGYMTEAGALLPIEKTKDVATTLPRVVAAAKQAGGDEKFAASFFGAATTAGVDVSGDPGATFVTSFLNKLGKEVPGAKSPMDAIKTLQADKGRSEKFVSEGFEARFTPFVKDLMSGGDASKQLDMNLGKAKSFKEAGGSYQEAIEAADVSPQIRLAKLNRTGGQITEALQVANTNEAAQSVVREIKAEIAKAAGDSAIEQSANSTLEWFKSFVESPTAAESTQSLIDDTRLRVGVLRAPSTDEKGRVYAQPTAADLKKADLIESYIPRLVEVLESMDANRDKPVNVKVKSSGQDPRMATAPRPAASLGGNGV